jgi:hypothetical protein
MNRYRSRIGTMLGTVALVALMSAPSHAIFGFGVHGGLDFTTFDAEQYSTDQFVEAAQRAGITDFDVNKWRPVNLTRKSIGNPYLIGGHFYVDLIPMIDLEASFDVALQKYNVNYVVEGYEAVANDAADIYFGRIGVYATGRRDLISLPMFAFYLGGGLGVHFVSPVAGPDFIVDIYGNNDPRTSKPNIKDNIERDMSVGYHALTGVRFKPPLVPFAFRLEGKYTSTGASGMERPSSVLSAYLGASFAI